MIYPHVEEIPYQDPLVIFQYFSSQEGAVFLDSSRMMEGCGRYSFIGVGPFLQLKSKNGFIQLNGQPTTGDPFSELETQLKKFQLRIHDDLPPFQGGVIGCFAYDLVHHLEKLPRCKDDMQFPDLVLGFYDVVIAFDHLVKRAWIFSSGFPLIEETARKARALKRLKWLLQQLQNVQSLPTISRGICQNEAITSNFSQIEYEAAVKQVIEYILSGDIFEANLSQRFVTELPFGLTPFDLYRRLRIINAAPFSAYLNFGDTIIASASPERFLKLANQLVETRPIKGTRPRGNNLEEDKSFANDLIQSEKDHAENVMIVDLLRNDLSRVCEDHSVQVPQLCGLESYATVHHLVSVVRGTLLKNKNCIDLLRATFPGGSITGAPKIRSMEIIAEIERVQRGPYCGSVAYIGFNGDLDSSIAIRTYAIKNNIVTFQAGGAIVADSDPAMEYQETLTKANALRRALTQIVEKNDITD